MARNRRVAKIPSSWRASLSCNYRRSSADKKTRAGRLRFVLPERVGVVRCGVEAEEEMLVRVLRECEIAAGRPETRKSRHK